MLPREELDQHSEFHRAPSVAMQVFAAYETGCHFNRAWVDVASKRAGIDWPDGADSPTLNLNQLFVVAVGHVAAGPWPVGAATPEKIKKLRVVLERHMRKTWPEEARPSKLTIHWRVAAFIHDLARKFLTTHDEAIEPIRAELCRRKAVSGEDVWEFMETAVERWRAKVQPKIDETKQICANMAAFLEEFTNAQRNAGEPVNQSLLKGVDDMRKAAEGTPARFFSADEVDADDSGDSAADVDRPSEADLQACTAARR